MKKKLFITSLILFTSLSACANIDDNDEKNLAKKNVETVESTTNKDLSLDTYTTFYSEGQFKLTIIDASIRKFEEIYDTNIIDNIKEKAKGKYVIYIDYAFEDTTIDTEFYMSSYRISDLMPKAKTEDGEELELVSATNLVPNIDNLKINEESIRAIFISEKKIDRTEFLFDIKDKLDRNNVYSVVLDLN